MIRAVAVLLLVALGQAPTNLLSLIAGPALADTRLAEPEAATGRSERAQTATATRHMVVAANPIAAEAGLDILRAGGTAVDAVIAVQMVLNVVEPQSSGIGGGAFLVHFDAAKSKVETIDGRETAPLSAKPDWFLDSLGKRLPFGTIVASPLSVGVPGVVRALALAHRMHGRLPWVQLLAPAIDLAEGGFAVSPRLSELLAAQGAAYFNAEARALFFDDAGTARPVGFILKNPALAATLRLLAARGADAFYTSAMADAVVAALPDDGSGQRLTVTDLAGYEAKARDPVCPPYRGFKLCSMGPPSSGGITQGMALGIEVAAEAMNPDKMAPTAERRRMSLGQRFTADQRPRPDANDPTALLRAVMPDIARLVEAEKLAYADRDHYLADPDFITPPAGLLDPAYLAARARLINTAHPMARAEPGTPPLKAGSLFGRDATIEQPGTSHVSIVDGEGNAAAYTTSIQTAFGSGIMVGGFLLNSELTDFSFFPADEAGTPIANRIDGGKRPRSSMAPTIIFDRAGQVHALLGSPGGNRIILYNAKAIVCLLHWACTPARAASLPNFGSRNGPIEVERGTLAETILGPGLAPPGYKVEPVDMTSGLAIIQRRGDVWEGAADPRREGIAVGD